jgi:hypothetical protein
MWWNIKKLHTSTKRLPICFNMDRNIGSSALPSNTFITPVLLSMRLATNPNLEVVIPFCRKGEKCLPHTEEGKELVT